MEAKSVVGAPGTIVNACATAPAFGMLRVRATSTGYLLTRPINGLSCFESGDRSQPA